MNPLHQFEIKKLFEISLCGYDISFTNSALFMVIAVLSVSFFFLLATKKNYKIPNRFQALMEIMYNFVADTVTSNAGKEGMTFFPLVFSVFFFVLAGNILGMIPYSFTYTSHIIVTFGLAMMVFVFVTILGFCIHGLKFLKFFVPSGVSVFLTPIIVPVEIISYLSRPISLSVRLFANMMAGHTMLKVFAGFSVSLGAIFGAIPMSLNVLLTGFEFVIACIQAYIFTVLTCIYLNDAIHMH